MKAFTRSQPSAPASSPTTAKPTPSFPIHPPPEPSTPNGQPVRNKILLIGQRRSGKTSIKSVIFENLPPKQSFYLETTMRIERMEYDTIIPLEIWDCPGNVTPSTLGVPLSSFSALIFVIDIRDVYKIPVQKLVEWIVAVNMTAPNVHVEVFVHKAERLQEDDKMENFRQIDGWIQDRLSDEGDQYENMQIGFYITSVYDHSLHDAFSRVLHKLVESLPHQEELLNNFCAKTGCQKAFLFDTNSRLYVASDSSPVDNHTHNLCSDYLQLLNSFTPLYTSDPTRPKPPTDRSLPTSPVRSSKPVNVLSAPPNYATSPTASFFATAAASLAGINASGTGTTGAGTVLSYHALTPTLALLAIVPTGIYQSKGALVEYNVVFVREAVQEICLAEMDSRRIGVTGVGGHSSSSHDVERVAL